VDFIDGSGNGKGKNYLSRRRLARVKTGLQSLATQTVGKKRVPQKSGHGVVVPSGLKNEKSRTVKCG